jgi:hypothetical protein
MSQEEYSHIAVAEFRTLSEMAKRTTALDNAKALSIVGEASASVRDALQAIEGHKRLKSFAAWPRWLDRIVIAECVERLSYESKPKLPTSCIAALTGALSVIARCVIPSQNTESESVARVAGTLLAVACDLDPDAEDDPAQIEMQVARSALWTEALYFCSRRCATAFKMIEPSKGNDLSHLFEHVVVEGGRLLRGHIGRAREQSPGKLDMTMAKQIAQRASKELLALSSIAAKKTEEFLAMDVSVDELRATRFAFSVSLLHPFGKVEVEHG